MATKLRVVTDDQSGAKPARKLGQYGTKLWRTIMSEYQIADAGGLEMLACACQQLDRAERCRETIDRDGEIIRSKAGMRDHPLLKHELQARSFVVRTLQRLGLNVEVIKPVGRPSRGIGWIPDGD
jgi:Phage terminase, small subunit